MYSVSWTVSSVPMAHVASVLCGLLDCCVVGFSLYLTANIDLSIYSLLSSVLSGYNQTLFSLNGSVGMLSPSVPAYSKRNIELNKFL